MTIAQRSVDFTSVGAALAGIAGIAGVGRGLIDELGQAHYGFFNVSAQISRRRCANLAL
ncbi:MAG: hypothetical protein ACR2MU_02115 [Gaiellaceae bacterium]